MMEGTTDQTPESDRTDASDAATATTDAATHYRVLARKYRPSSFKELIGQDAMVRILTNAMVSGRLAHAFVLTGVRGVGKTTTARIIARALNCVGPDGTGGPTIEPCGVCANCVSIAEDRNTDVIEMDAASRTGVDDIREVIEGVRYRPVSCRYKVYIIDEVHMLSRNAFNALLKTLEEPPPHVKFIFATTEIRKVPVTVLSRCQRFDLPRVPFDTLKRHFAEICGKEAVQAEEAATALIARAADGSVRDGLSMLDQAIALSGDGALSETLVRDMLGLADRERILDLADALFAGRVAEALEQAQALYRDGADPLVVIQDLLDVAHLLTRMKAAPDALEALGLPEAERTRGRAMAEALSMAALTRAWQMLLKGLGEVQVAPSPIDALEMVMIRLCFAVDLPDPSALAARLEGAVSGTQPPAPEPAPPSAPEPAAVAPAVETARQDDATAPFDFAALVALFAERNQGLVYAHLYNEAHLVRYEPGRLEIRLASGAPTSLSGEVKRLLDQWTGRSWIVALSDAPGAPTLKARAEQAETERRREVAAHPDVRAVLEQFPRAEIVTVRDHEDMESAAPGPSEKGERTG